MSGPGKNDLVGMLREVALLLEFQGENQFKVRAYENGARALETSALSVGEMAGNPQALEKIPGIGKSIAHVIVEALQLGHSPYLEQLHATTPGGLLEMLKVPNLGPKKVRQLYEKLGLCTIAGLEEGCRSGAVEQLPGFGKKSAEKILAGIEMVRSFSGRFLHADARPSAANLVEWVRGCPEVQRAEIAGSLRRSKETVADIDILASSASPRQVMEHFAALPGIRQVIVSGDTKTSVVLGPGIQADLRVVADDQFACALQYFTGSKEHNTRVRALAQRMGLRANEYGIFHADDSGGKLDIPDEQAFYRALGLDYIEPELREDAGEVDAAAKHQLPRLVEYGDYAGVLHVHSDWSDGNSSIIEMARAARDMGWSYLGICDHSEAAFYAGGIKSADIASQHAEIDEANAQMEPEGLRILKGCECDILADGSLDYPEEVLASMDFVVASIHSRFQMSHDEMTARLVGAVRNPYTSILGHPSGRLLLSREAYSFDLQQVLKAAAATRTIIEINCDPQRMDLDWRHCHAARDMGILFAVNPDAHTPRSLDFVHGGIATARKGWLRREDVVNCLPVEALLDLFAAIRRFKSQASA